MMGIPTTGLVALGVAAVATLVMVLLWEGVRDR